MVAGGQRTLPKQRGWRVLLCTFAALLCHAVSAGAGTYVVTNTADAGAGSLRQAIIDLNAAGDAANTISFQTSGTITLASEVDAIDEDVVFVGASGVKLVLPSVGTGSTLYGFEMANGVNLSGDFFSEVEVHGTGDVMTGVGGFIFEMDTGVHGAITSIADGDNSVGLFSYALRTTDITGTIRSEAGQDLAAAIATDNVFFSQGDISGDVSATVGRDEAYAISSPLLELETISGTVTATAGRNIAYAFDAIDMLVHDDISGSIVAYAAGEEAIGISAMGEVLIENDISGSVFARAELGRAAGIFVGALYVDNDISGTITAQSGAETAFGMTAIEADIQDFSGTISATAETNGAFGLHAEDLLYIRGELSGSITATAGGHTAVGLYSDLGTINGGDAATAADITGTIRAQASGQAVGIAALGPMTLSISGTVSGVDTSGGGEGYSIRSGNDDAGAWNATNVEDDLVMLQEGASLVGHIDLGLGADTLGLFGSGTVAGDLRNIEVFDKFGSGRWIINGHTDVTDIVVDGGSLRLSSSAVGSPTNLVSGGLDVAAGAALEVAIHQTAASSLDVTGLAWVEGSVIFIPATIMAPGTTFTAMNAGNLGPTAGYTAPLFAVDASSGTSVVLTKVGYSDVLPLSPNAQTMADMLEPCMITATGDLCFLLMALENASTVEEFEANLEALTPVVQTSLSGQSFGLGGMFSSALGLHLAQARDAFTALAEAERPESGIAESGVALLGMDPGDPTTWPLLADAGELSTLGALGGGAGSGMTLLDDGKTSVFLRALASEGGTADSGDYFGHTSRTFGLTGGVDRLLAQGLMGGVNVGFANTSASYNDQGSTAEIRSWNLGVFASRFDEDWYVDAALSLGINRYEVDRVLGFVNRTAESNYGGRLFSASVEGGWSLPAGPVVLTPLGSITFARLDQDGYEESGAGAADLTVAAHSRHSLVSGIGLQASLPLETQIGSVVPEVSATWTHEYLTRDLGVETTMAGNPGEVYTMLGAEPERDSLRLGAAVAMQADNGSSLTLRWQGDYKESSWSNGGMVEYRISF